MRAMPTGIHYYLVTIIGTRMGRVHFFQRYSQRENVVTNNTLLLLARLNEASTPRFNALLSAWLDKPALDLGLHFEQQRRAQPGSIPDGRIFQQSIELVLEVKLGAGYGVQQLVNHLDQFRSEHGQRLLVLLRPQPLPEADQRPLQAEAREKGVQFVAATFSGLIAAIRAALLPHEFELHTLIDDYEAYCTEEQLTALDIHRMRIVPCSETWQDNLRFALYYQPASRGFSPHAYVGIYSGKAVRAIGRIAKQVVVELADEQVHVLEGSSLTNEERGRILDAVEAARAYGYDVHKGYRFFLFDSCEATFFEKKTPYPIQGARFEDLRERLGYAGDPPPVHELAKRLRGESW